MIVAGRKRWLKALAALAFGLGVSTAQAARQCRVQECWDTPFGVFCYYDSGWYDC